MHQYHDGYKSPRDLKVGMNSDGNLLQEEHRSASVGMWATEL